MDEIKILLEDYIGSLDADEIIALHNTYCVNTNHYDDIIYSMDEFDEEMRMAIEGRDDGPWWLACRLFYGDFNPTDDYFVFNGNGNLDSYPKYRIIDEIYTSDIIAHIIENDDDLDDSEIRDILNGEF